MRIDKLWDKHRGSIIFVIGTGPSMRTFPIESLEGALIIGLNQAWRYFANTEFVPQLMLTAHPELYLEYSLEAKPNQFYRMAWVIKKKSPMTHLGFDDPVHYVYQTEENWDLVRKRVPDTLFLGRGIQCTAISLAAHMGAKTVILVGCDMCDLNGDHHGHSQHTQFHGLQSGDVYTEYRKWTAKTRKIVRDELGVNVLTMSPFVGLGHASEDYGRLGIELKLPKLPAPKDVSTYKRKKADL